MPAMLNAFAAVSSAGRDGPYPSLSAGRTDIFGWPLAALGR